MVRLQDFIHGCVCVRVWPLLLYSCHEWYIHTARYRDKDWQNGYKFNGIGCVGMCQCSMNTSTQFLATHLILCLIIQMCETTKWTVLSTWMHYCLFRLLSVSVLVSVSRCVNTITVKRIKHRVNHCGTGILMHCKLCCTGEPHHCGRQITKITYSTFTAKCQNDKGVLYLHFWKKKCSSKCSRDTF